MNCRLRNSDLLDGARRRSRRQTAEEQATAYIQSAAKQLRSQGLMPTKGLIILKVEGAGRMDAEKGVIFACVFLQQPSLRRTAASALRESSMASLLTSQGVQAGRPSGRDCKALPQGPEEGVVWALSSLLPLGVSSLPSSDT